ncbi:hypothetical protein [Cognatishimia sp. F0-27]|uniref:hypothetical protein n=1 Tax=Cognatishimia sp. F0-27 TaxID=2816855 RepID=UPI001D0C10BB|nr:hypothetical protein [Cognatishimia sp. F0-27]MCC1493308.1 hypothetical protein [Cognatishimia sp. F0-27]
MPATPAAEILLGCFDQVRLVVIEDEGNLILQVFATDPAATDVDALFFNLTNDADAPALTVFPAFDESIGSNGENLTGFDVATGALNQLNNGAQIAESYDVRVEFGEIPYSSGGDVDQAAFTLYVDGNGSTLTADSIDLSNLTVVINSDNGGGLALTNGSGPDSGAEYQTVTLSEDLTGVTSATGSDLIADSAGWAFESGGFLSTNGSNDGALLLQTVETDGPVSLSFDARAINLDRFEASGQYADSLRVEVAIDGGAFILLDEFRVDETGTALVGSETGALITSLSTAPTYSGGVLDSATQSVQFRITSDISANDEQILIDNLVVTTTQDVSAPTTVEAVGLSEDFDTVADPDDSAAVEVDGGWDVRYGSARTDGRNEGEMRFTEVATDGPASISLDMRACETSYFENSGQYADSLRVEVQVDGGDWVLLDEFRVNDAGTEMVGSVTGQSFGETFETLTYEGGVLDAATSGVQMRVVSDISAGNEVLFVDNVEITVTEEVAEGEVCEDFNAGQSGDVVADQFDGFSVVGQRAGDAADSENDAMLFDTANPTGGDTDLAYASQGNAIIISEDNDSSDADDNAGGGTLHFTFDAVSDVQSVTLLDIEEPGGTIDLFDADGTLISTVAIPAEGDNSATEVAIDATGVATMEVTLVGSGAVDDLCFAPSGVHEECVDYAVTYDEMMVQQTEEQVPDEALEQTDDLADMMV